jgi:Phosphotransferase enzyme family
MVKSIQADSTLEDPSAAASRNGTNSELATSIDTLPLHIACFLQEIFSRDEDPTGDAAECAIIQSVQQVQSAQQRVWIVTVQKSDQYTRLQTWSEALENGNHRLVVRQWRGASRWWNLHHPSAVPAVPASSEPECNVLESVERRVALNHIARQEVWGYKTARRVFKGGSTAQVIRIPHLLHFQPLVESDTAKDGRNLAQTDELGPLQYPWAVLEYVGPESTTYSEDKDTQPNTDWINGMVRIRHEFGFDEPHPRWGRVPEDSCLGYAMTVLKQVILPIHAFCCRNPLDDKACGQPIQFADMVDLYQSKLDTCLKRLVSLEAPLSGRAYTGGPLESNVAKLEQAIRDLHERKNAVPPTARGVLCHMDYQPQNLFFGKPRTLVHSGAPDTNAASSSWITSVLDWEEAAYADPRFDLLMLCRKVCASRSQAKHLWQTYRDEMSLVDTNWPDDGMGSMDPWLTLETVHSITSMLLQATAGGGRNSWESQRDLWNKIDREFQRLEAKEDDL